MTRRLEQKFAEIFQTEFAISFVNGTATLHSALVAAGIGPGDEVIVPPLTMASTAFAVLHAQATPVFADIDSATWTISPKSIEEQITDRTKAIMPVALYGLAPDMDAITSIGRRNNLFVLEDDAECFLGYYKGRVVGSIGDAASFSFQSSKHVTSGEGGIVTTNDEELARKVRRFGSLGYAGVGARPGEGKISKDVIQDPSYERHVSVGWNYRMPELCAAVALGQLERLHELVDARRRVASKYSQAIGECDWLVEQTVPVGLVHSYWTYTLKLTDDIAFTWQDFRQKYMELGGDGIYGAWRLNYLEPAFRSMKQGGEQAQRYAPGLCPVAESVQPRLLQFKTNYWTAKMASEKAAALEKTVEYFEQL
jgi:perosamine synthetase